MYIFGKLFGGFLGYLMAGPLGALVGIMVGNVFDKSLRLHMNQSYQNFRFEKRPEVTATYIKAIACLMGFFAKADGRVSEQELSYAASIFKELKLSGEQLHNAKEWFTTSKNGQVSLEDQLRMLQYLKEKNLALTKNCLDIVFQMLKIDGLTEKKVNYMNYLLNNLGFATLENQFNAQEFWEYIQSKAQKQYHSQGSYQYQDIPKTKETSIDDAYKTLGLNVNSNQTEVKKAYRKLMSKYHPDKMMAKGASPQEIKAATEKTQQISKAYDYICHYKGW
jgi:DnaJ like chaperone protein